MGQFDWTNGVLEGGGAGWESEPGQGPVKMRLTPKKISFIKSYYTNGREEGEDHTNLRRDVPK